MGYLLVAATEPSWAVERAGRQRPRECGSGGGTIASGVCPYIVSLAMLGRGSLHSCQGPASPFPLWLPLSVPQA